MGPPARTFTVTLDMNKAFDTINIHTNLLHTKIPGTIIKCIAGFINGRKAYTRYINHTSSQRQFKPGVPQGGVLSPTLFNIYTAYIPPPRAPVQMTSPSYLHTQSRVQPGNTCNHTYIKFLLGQNKLPQTPHSHYNRHKTNMRHIHTSIVSRHLATRGNKILRTPPTTHKQL